MEEPIMNKNEFIGKYQQDMTVPFERKNPNFDIELNAIVNKYKEISKGYCDFDIEGVFSEKKIYKYRRRLIGYIGEMMNFVPRNELEKIRNYHILFDVIENYEFNAVSYRIPDEPFIALLFNINVFELLHKYHNYTLAKFFPEYVYYENGQIHPKQDIFYYKKRMNELINTFDRKGDISSFDILLNVENTSVEAAMFLKRYISEMFFLAHELGHVINGDLTDNNNYITKDGSLLFKSVLNHEKEFNADFIGFQLVLAVLGKKMLDTMKSKIISIIHGIYEFMFWLYGGETYTHPNPYVRCLRLVEKTYGINEAKFLLYTMKLDGIDVEYQFVTTDLTGVMEFHDLNLDIEVSDIDLFQINYPYLLSKNYNKVRILEKNKVSGFADILIITMKFIYDAALSGITWDFFKRMINVYISIIFGDKKQNARSKDVVHVYIKNGNDECKLDIPDSSDILKIDIPNKLKILFKP
jgi:hypothetical protein